jgi:hypothetical protein
MPDELRKRKPGWVDRLSPTTKLILATLLGVAIGLEIGVLVSRGGMEALYDMVTGPYVRDDDNAPLTGFMLILVFIVTSKIWYFIGNWLLKAINDELLRWFVWGIPFFLLDYLLLSDKLSTPLIFWTGWFGILVVGRIPIGLLILTLTLFGIFPITFRFGLEPSYMYLPLIITLSFVLYPSTISLKRFLFPARGVI